MLYFYKCHGAPITKKYIKTALAVVFQHKNFSSGIFKLGHARENMGVIEQVFRTDAPMIFDKKPNQSLLLPLILYLKSFKKIIFAIILPVLSQKNIRFLLLPCFRFFQLEDLFFINQLCKIDF